LECGGATRDGYVLVRVGHRKSMGAHRVVWEYFNGVIPEGLCVLHKCDNRKCVEVSHLFLGDRAANNADKVSKGRQARGRSHGMAVREHRKNKINMGIANRIRHLYKTTAVTQRELAAQFGLSQGLISKTINGKRWIQ